MPDPGDSTTERAGGDVPLALDVVHDAGDWSPFEPVGPGVEAAGIALALHPQFRALGACEACVALSDDAAVRRLNAGYRGKDKPTNVLSFPSGAPEHARVDGRRPLGDILLAAETVLGEAREQGIPPAHHLQHLVVHGLLHLLGFDHETDADAEEMESLEIEILARLGIANPYGEVAPEAARADH